MGRNNKSIHLLRGNENNTLEREGVVLDSGQPFYDKYNRSIYIGDGKTSLNNLTPISGSWDYIDDGGDTIPSSKILSKIKTAGFLFCTDKGNEVAIQDLNRDDDSVMKDKWHLIYTYNPSGSSPNTGAILAIGDSTGVFYGNIVRDSAEEDSISWSRLTNQPELAYAAADGTGGFNIKLTYTPISEGDKTKIKEIIPSLNSDINLGSDEFGFNTIYSKYYNGNGIDFRPTQFKEGSTNVDIGYGYSAAASLNHTSDTPRATIDTHIFYDGLGSSGLSWIKSKGIVPYSNNEINFNIITAADTEKGTNNLVFGNQGSTAIIENYVFYNGKGTSTYSSIKCKNLYAATDGYVQASYFNATSDKRLKENIIPFTSEKSILDLPVYTFNFKSDEKKKKHVGCLAQDLQEICPDLVNEDSQGYLSIEESKITYLLLEEVKELKKQVEELKEKVNELEGK